MLQLEQKPGKCVTAVVSKFCKGRELLIYTCTRTLATDQVCLQSLLARRIFGGEKDVLCFLESLLSLLKDSSLWVMNPYSDLAGNEKNKNRARCLLRICKLFVRKKGWQVGSAGRLGSGAYIPCAYCIFCG